MLLGSRRLYHLLRHFDSDFDELFKVVADFTAIVSMTDGVTDPLFETDQNFEDSKKWDAFWETLTVPSDYTEHVVTPDSSNLQLESELREWLNFFSKGNHDDRTIAMLLPTSSASPNLTAEASE